MANKAPKSADALLSERIQLFKFKLSKLPAKAKQDAETDLKDFQERNIFMLKSMAMALKSVDGYASKAYFIGNETVLIGLDFIKAICPIKLLLKMLPCYRQSANAIEKRDESLWSRPEIADAFKDFRLEPALMWPDLDEKTKDLVWSEMESILIAIENVEGAIPLEEIIPSDRSAAVVVPASAAVAAGGNVGETKKKPSIELSPEEKKMWKEHVDPALLRENPQLLQVLEKQKDLLELEVKKQNALKEQHNKLRDVLTQISVATSGANGDKNSALRRVEQLNQNIEKMSALGDAKVNDDERGDLMFQFFTDMFSVLFQGSDPIEGVDSEQDALQQDMEEWIEEPHPDGRLRSEEEQQKRQASLEKMQTDAQTDETASRKLMAFYQSLKQTRVDRQARAKLSFRRFVKTMNRGPLTDAELVSLKAKDAIRIQQQKTNPFSLTAHFNRSSQVCLALLCDRLGDLKSGVPGRTHLLLFPQLNESKKALDALLERECGSRVLLDEFGAWVGKHQERVQRHDGQFLFGGETHPWLGTISARHAWKRLSTNDKATIWTLMEPWINSTLIEQSLRRAGLHDELFGLLNDALRDMKVRDLGELRNGVHLKRKLKKALFARFSDPENSGMVLFFHKLKTSSDDSTQALNKISALFSEFQALSLGRVAPSETKSPSLNPASTNEPFDHGVSS